MAVKKPGTQQPKRKLKKRGRGPSIGLGKPKRGRGPSVGLGKPKKRGRGPSVGAGKPKRKPQT